MSLWASSQTFRWLPPGVLSSRKEGEEKSFFPFFLFFPAPSVVGGTGTSLKSSTGGSVGSTLGSEGISNVSGIVSVVIGVASVKLGASFSTEFVFGISSIFFL